jgi:hypothetical protein
MNVIFEEIVDLGHSEIILGESGWIDTGVEYCFLHQWAKHFHQEIFKWGNFPAVWDINKWIGEHDTADIDFVQNQVIEGDEPT